MEYKSPGFRGTRHRVEFISRVGTFPFACSLKSARNWWLVNFISSNDVDSIRRFVDTLLVDIPRFLFFHLFFIPIQLTDGVTFDCRSRTVIDVIRILRSVVITDKPSVS